VFLGPFVVIAFPIAFVVSIAHAVVIGLPAYLILRLWFRVNYGNAALAGFLIGCIPVGVYAGVSVALEKSGTWEPLIISPVFGVLGALGGLAFRAVLGPDEDRYEVDASIFE
jgi:hypothetical protein